jgi:hypothetical protein
VTDVTARLQQNINCHALSKPDPRGIPEMSPVLSLSLRFLAFIALSAASTAIMALPYLTIQ